MATETSVNTYTGVEGVLQVGGNPFAYVKAEVSIDRAAVEIPRGGKWSAIKLPGAVDPKIKITYGLVDSDLLINSLDDGTNTTSSSDEAIHASIPGNAALQSIITALSNPSVPMTIKIKIISTDGYSAGAITVMGTDANDVLISEAIPFPTVPTGSTTLYYYGHTRFKTVTLITIPIVLSANDGVTPYGMGQKTVLLGKPLMFTFVGKLMKSATQYTQITATNCWLKNYHLPLNSNVEAALIDQELVVRDPDADIQVISTL